MEDQQFNQNEIQQKEIIQNQQNKEVAIITFDDPKLFTLPQLIPFDFRNEQYIKLKQSSPQDLQPLIEQIEQYILKNLKIWDIQENQQFKFTLPSSIFEQLQNKKKIEYLQQGDIVEEYNNVQKLTEDQLTQIRQNGTFKVESKIFPDPYIWQLSTWIIKGVDNIYASLNDDLSCVFHQLLQLKERIYCDEQKQHFWLCNVNLSGSMESIFYFFGNIFCLIFGWRKMTQISKYEIDKDLEFQRQYEIIGKIQEQKINIFFFLLFYQKYIQLKNNQQQYNQYQKEYEDLKEHFKKLDQDFNQIWTDQKKKEEELKLKNERSKYHTKLREAKYNFLFQYIEKNASPIYKQNLTELIITLEIILLEDLVRQDKFNNEIQALKKQLENDHKIKSKVSLWFEKQVEQQSAIIQKKLEQQFIEAVKLKLIQLNLNNSVFFLQEYLQFYYNYQIIYSKNEDSIIDKLQVPRRTFKTERYLFPPYEIVKNESKYNNTISWHLEKSTFYETNTSIPFWRVKLMLQRYFSWSFNASFCLFINAFFGQLSLKALFVCDEYYLDQTVNQNTGQIEGCGSKIMPVVSLFLSVLEGMDKSRSNFEEQPDQGFFGKNCARICNYIECYFFRFFLVGIVGVLLLMPILIIINSLLSIILALTSWVWIPVIMLIYYLFIMIFYDFDSEYMEKQDYNDNNRLSIWFPIIVEIYRLSFKGIIQLIISLLFLLVFHPLAVVICLVFSFLRLILRSIYDFLMFQLISCLGRQPVQENNIAWKISGYGVGRRYFYSIQYDDLVLILWTELEKAELQIFADEMYQKINFPYQNATDVYNQLFQPFINQSYSFNEISKRNSKLKNQLDEFIKKRKNLYPTISNSSNIRLTQQELNQYFALTLAVVIDFIKKRKLEHKIFKHFNIEEEENYNLLTEKIWKQALNSDILIPLEDIESRFQLKRVEDQFSFISTKQALDGQLSLNQFIQEINLKPKFEQKIDQVPNQFISIQFIVNLLLQQERNPAINDLTNVFFLDFEAMNLFELKNSKNISNEKITIKIDK